MITRRRFLGSLAAAGSAAALFPWLNAAAGTSPKRLVLFFTPHGTVWDQWRPSGSETSFTLPSILDPLEAHRDRVAIVDGIAMRTGTEYYIPHTYTMPVIWTGSPIDTSASMFCREDHGGRCFGWNTGVSVDQAIAARLTEATPYKTIELGLACGGLHPATRMIYSAPGTPKSALDDPARAFNTLFATEEPDDGAAERTAARRRSVLHAVNADFSSRRGRLSPADRQRLDAHATSLEELERSLAPADCGSLDAPSGVNSETAIDHQSDIIAAALGCGLTRIMSMQVRIADNDNSLYPWLGLTSGGHHTLSHDSGATAQAMLAKVYRWYTQRFVYLLDRLAETPDGNGQSVLDNTFVIWGSELGQAWDHNIDNVPFVFAGGEASGLRGGRYLRVSGLSNRVLVTAFHAMGMTDVESYGSLDDDEGPVPGVLGS